MRGHVIWRYGLLQKNQIPQAAIAVALAVYIIINILLTPPGGYTTRPATSARETSWGLIAIVLLLVGAVLGLASLLLLFSRPRLSVILGLIGAGLHYPAFLADGTGPYSTRSHPPT